MSRTAVSKSSAKGSSLVRGRFITLEGPDGAGKSTQAKRLRAAPIRQQLAAALDDWVLTTILNRPLQEQRKDAPLWLRLLELARRIDPEPWLDRLRRLHVWTDREALAALAQEAQHAVAAQPDRPPLTPRAYEMLAVLLREHGQDAEAWLRQGQLAHPADFWLAMQLGYVLHSKKKWSEAVGFYRAALAVRPRNTVVYNNLSAALHEQQDLDGVIAICKKALALDPGHLEARSLRTTIQEP